MVCANCGNRSAHIKITPDGERCPKCGGFAEAGGTPVDGILARNSHRVRQQQSHYEKDTLTPHIYDKNLKALVPNPEFIKRFPDTAHINYHPKELEVAGYKKLAKQVHERRLQDRQKKDTGVKFKGNTKEGIKKVIGNV